MWISDNGHELLENGWQWLRWCALHLWDRSTLGTCLVSWRSTQSAVIRSFKLSYQPGSDRLNVDIRPSYFFRPPSHISFTVHMHFYVEYILLSMLLVEMDWDVLNIRRSDTTYSSPWFTQLLSHGNHWSNWANVCWNGLYAVFKVYIFGLIIYIWFNYFGDYSCEYQTALFIIHMWLLSV